MVKYLCIEKCSQCPHWDEDPQTTEERFWGKEVCTYFWVEDENQIRLLEPDIPIPDWCELDGPNDL